jgi:hypothetical protein
MIPLKINNYNHMKYSVFFLLLFAIIGSCFAQENISSKTFISVAKEPPKPPYLEIKNYSFSDSDGNKKINAGESSTISFELYNSGMGPGLGLVLSVKEKNGITGLTYNQSIKLKELPKDEKMQITVPIKGSIDLQTGEAAFTLVVDEANGFDSDPLTVEIATRAFKEPLVKMVDYQVSSQMSGTLKKRKPFDLEVLIQNVGQGVAQDISVTVNQPLNVFCLSGNLTQFIESLQPGEKRAISYSFITNNEYSESTINFNFDINEKYNKYTENGGVTLTMNQKVSAEKLVIKGEADKTVAIQVASLSSDVDKNIPVSEKVHPNKIALIFGNEDYSGSINSEIDVDYAVRDAAVFKKYAIKTLGIPEENIYYRENATAGTMNSTIELVTEIVKRMKNQPEIIFYYAGHGFPDENTHVPYLIPVDVNATNLNSAISLKDVYHKLGKTGAAKITVLLDACFSGGGRNQGLLAARSIMIKPKEENAMGNMVVFSASTGEQSSLPYHAKKHGMFTYYLLKKLQESNGTVTFGVLNDYLKDNVGIKSLQINGKVQDPTTTISPALQANWKELTF